MGKEQPAVGLSDMHWGGESCWVQAALELRCEASLRRRRSHRALEGEEEPAVLEAEAGGGGVVVRGGRQGGRPGSRGSCWPG